MSDYWNDRKDLAYYDIVFRYASLYAPEAKTLLDVGAGVSMGARYLEKFNKLSCTAVERSPQSNVAAEWSTRSGIELVSNTDFIEWVPSQTYDLVLCLQVLEHLDNPAPFAHKLFACATQAVIISVPYKWKADRCEYHKHDPVDPHKLKSWVEREPAYSCIASERFIAMYTPV